MNALRSFEDIDKIVRGFAPSRVILTAVYLDIFTKIGDEPKSAAQIATSNKWNERGTTILLDALTALTLLSKDNDKYSNSDVSAEYLRRDKPTFRGWGFLHRNTMWLGWSNLTAVVTNKHYERPSNLHNEEFNKYFINAMHEFHYEEAHKIADIIDINKVEKMIDLAGGPGSYTIAFANKNPKLKGVIADLPNTLKITKQKIKEFGMEERIETKQCDLFADNLNVGNDYDLVLISNLFHAAGEKNNIELLRKTYPIVKNGGKVIVNEIYIDDTKTAPLDGALFSINMLVQTETGNTYPQSKIMRWIEDAGFKASSINNNLTVGTK